MIKDCKVNTGGDNASAVLYQKWHVLAPNFITDLSEGRFSLEGGMVDHLATSVEVANLVMQYDGKLLKRTQLKGAPLDVFPVNDDHIFYNARSVERDVSLCWLRFSSETHILSVQIVSKVVVEVAYDLQTFPYDRHLIPFELATRRDTAGRRWVQCAEIPVWAEPTVEWEPEDSTILFESFNERLSEFDRLPPLAVLQGVNRPFLAVRVRRKPAFVVWNIMLPIITIISVALATFVVPDTSTEMRFSAIITSSLTLATFRATMLKNSIPMNVNYLTGADWYIVLVFTFVGMMTVRCIYISYIHDAHSRENVVERTDNNIWEHIASLINFVTITHPKLWDWLLFLVWLIPHLVLIADVTCFDNALVNWLMDYGTPDIVQQEFLLMRRNKLFGEAFAGLSDFGGNASACFTDERKTQPPAKPNANHNHEVLQRPTPPKTHSQTNTPRSSASHHGARTPIGQHSGTTAVSGAQQHNRPVVV